MDGKKTSLRYSLKKHIVFLLGVLLICGVTVNVSAQETMTIGTYYPSPFGSYNSLRLYPASDIDPTASCTNAGEMFYHATDNQIYVCDGALWQTLGESYWELTGDTVHTKNPNWNVGYRIDEPQHKLELVLNGGLHMVNPAGTDMSVRIAAGSGGSAALALWDTEMAEPFAIAAHNRSGSHNLSIQYGDNSIMEFTPSGTVGVNTTAPDTNYKLDVNQMIRINNVFTDRKPLYNCTWSANRDEVTCRGVRLDFYTVGYMNLDNYFVGCTAGYNGALLACSVDNFGGPCAGTICVDFTVSTLPSDAHSEAVPTPGYLEPVVNFFAVHP